jgi:DNA-binding NarL/FixJ family response regulator
MPGMGGKKCLEEILRVDPFQRLVIASGYSAEGAVKEALQGGAGGFYQEIL